MITETWTQALLASGLGSLTGFLGSLLGFQINLVAIQYGIKYRRRTAFLAGLGALIADVVLFFVALKGATQLLPYLKWKNWIKAATVLILVAVALKLMRSKSAAEVQKARSRVYHVKSFLSGLFLVLGNPGVFILWASTASFLLVHFDQFQIDWFRYVFLAAFSAGALIWYGFLAWGVGRLKLMEYEKILMISRISSILILAGAIGIIVGT